MQNNNETINNINDWVECYLRDLYEFEYGKSLTEKKRDNNGSYPVYGSNGIVGYHSEYLVEGPALIVGRKGAVGEISITEKNFWPIDTTYYIKVSKYLSIKFSYYLLKFLRLNLLDKSTTIPGLNRNDAYALKIKIPTFLEQWAIVAKIEQLFSELDNGIASLKKIQEQLKVYRQAVLKWAFEGKLTEKWREENNKSEITEEFLKRINEERQKIYEQQLMDYQDGKSKTKPKPFRKITNYSIDELSELPKISKEYIWIKLEDISDQIFDGPFGSNLKSIDYVDKGVRVIRLENIGKLEFKNELKSFVSEEKYLSIKNHTVYSGDIIFSSFISDEIRVVVLPSNINKAINKADCFCIRVNKKLFNNYFISYFLSTKTTFNQLVNKIHGATRPRINTTQLKNCFIPYCSLNEQLIIIQEIESRFSLANKLEEVTNECLQKIEVLKQSILRKAFEGGLLSGKEIELIKSDPDWESAGKLFEKINTERVINKEVQKTKILEEWVEIVEEELKDLLTILKESPKGILAKVLWQKSIYKDDIDGFYTELKRMESQNLIIEKKIENESYIGLKNENR